MQGQDYYLDQLGIQRWVRRSTPTAPAIAPEVVLSPSVTDIGAGSAAAASVAPSLEVEAPRPRTPQPTPATDRGSAWETLRRQVAACQACGLEATRTQTVFGVGAVSADWMVIGEAPGAEEDRQGEPFVGRAGQLLNAMLTAIGLAREQVYIANVLKCRPPNNRDPLPAEVAHCEPFLLQQVALVQPRLILALGRIAAQNLLKTDIPISRLRGQVFTYSDKNIPVVVTYHPAYLLRSPGEKRKAWEDLKLARRISRDGTQELTEQIIS